MTYSEAYLKMREGVTLACELLAKQGAESAELKHADEAAIAAIVEWNKIRLGSLRLCRCWRLAVRLNLHHLT